MKITTQLQKFKVVRILDEYRIIINAGKEANVTANSYFEITGAVDKVYDPDTQEFLGTIDGVKATVYPMEIFDKMCICRARRSFSPKDIPFRMGLIDQMIFGRPEKLPVDRAQISNPEAYAPIVIGDKAIMYEQVKEDPPPDTEDSSE